MVWLAVFNSWVMNSFKWQTKNIWYVRNVHTTQNNLEFKYCSIHFIANVSLFPEKLLQFNQIIHLSGQKISRWRFKSHPWCFKRLKNIIVFILKQQMHKFRHKYLVFFLLSPPFSSYLSLKDDYGNRRSNLWSNDVTIVLIC